MSTSCSHFPGAAQAMKASPPQALEDQDPGLSWGPPAVLDPSAWLRVAPPCSPPSAQSQRTAAAHAHRTPPRLDANSALGSKCQTTHSYPLSHGHCSSGLVTWVGAEGLCGRQAGSLARARRGDTAGDAVTCMESYWPASQVNPG